ncbi:ubiquitin-protein ligase molybdopterin-converting factor [Hyaloraphidium curvatum]|nr:ubiquitin-protein ligase molybdopterin-converting factor [Hyaloraphidium curvatum]
MASASAPSGLPATLLAILRDLNTPAVRASLATFAATSAAFLVAAQLSRRNRIRKLREQLSNELGSGIVTPFETSFSGSDPFSAGLRPIAAPDETLVREQLARCYAFFGDEKMARIRGAFVVVVGLGGVGSHAANLLARSGVGRLRLVDFDQVTLSSLNRHAMATQADVGIPKAVCIRNHLQRIAPFVDVEIAVELFNAESADKLLAGNPDWVLDCIDNIDTKVDLIAYCVEHKLQIMSSMGSGTKSDPSQIQIGDLWQSQEDPLARTVRRRLRVQKGIEEGVTVVFSTEKPGPVKLLPLPDDVYESGTADDLAPLPDFRARILPVLGTLPAMFGDALAGAVLLRIAGWESFDPLPVKGREKTYSRVYRDLRARDENHYRANPVCPYINVEEAGYLVDEVYRGFSVLSRSHDRLNLARWDVRQESRIENLVLMTKSEADKHDKAWAEAIARGEELDLVARYGEDVVALVRKRLDQVKREMKWRT